MFWRTYPLLNTTGTVHLRTTQYIIRCGITFSVGVSTPTLTIILYLIIYCVVSPHNCIQPDDGQKWHWPKRAVDMLCLINSTGVMTVMCMHNCFLMKYGTLQATWLLEQHTRYQANATQCNSELHVPYVSKQDLCCLKGFRPTQHELNFQQKQFIKPYLILSKRIHFPNWPNFSKGDLSLWLFPCVDISSVTSLEFYWVDRVRLLQECGQDTWILFSFSD